MSKRTNRLLLEDILATVSKIELYVFGIDKAHFLKDGTTVDAVTRHLQIIGEAAGRLPVEFTDGHPEIEWRNIAGLRNRIVHEYFGVDSELVWEIVRTNLPELKKSLEGLLD
ncbi:MAG: DUF86 domain-containing protein [Dehalococcoidia bacterium]|nr:DUF86 domain-containing protein [Dehalococcoidia bacterium]